MRNLTATVSMTILFVACASAGERMAIDGRDVTVDANPVIFHGMVHAGVDQFDTLQQMGISC